MAERGLRIRPRPAVGRGGRKGRRAATGGWGRGLLRLARVVLLALLFAFLAGFVIGTLLRPEVDRPVRYLGARDAAPASIVAAPDPGDVGHALARVLVARDHEEQI